MKHKNSMTPTANSIGADSTLDQATKVKWAEDIRHSPTGDGELVADVLLNKDIVGSGH